uniref:Uncharacterized protein n=1 Tax=viral metagenome TaxID=1070528 RepID=A0A6C0BJE6_9ZZZZ
MHLLLKIDTNANNRTARDALRDYYRTYHPKYPTDSELDLMIPLRYEIPSHTTATIHLGICCEIDPEEGLGQSQGHVMPHGIICIPEVA